MTELCAILASVLILGIVVERATELLHDAKIFLPLRNWIAFKAYPPGAPPLEPLHFWVRFKSAMFGRFTFSDERPYLILMQDYHPVLENKPEYGRRLAHFVNAALGCGYCTSVWVAMPFALVCPLPFHASLIGGWVIRVVLLHGISNLYHVLYERQKKWASHPLPIHLMVDMQDNEIIESEDSDV